MQGSTSMKWCWLMIAVLAWMSITIGCGGGPRTAKLTSEQEAAATQMEQSLDELRTRVQTLLMELGASSSSAAVHDALADAQFAVHEAEPAVAALRSPDSRPFEQKRAEAEEALRKLTEGITAVENAARAAGDTLP